MLATVLKGELATKQSIFIMRAFKEMRHFIANNALMFEKINAIELKQLEYQKDTDEKFGRIFEYMANHEEEKRSLISRICSSRTTLSTSACFRISRSRRISSAMAS